MTYDLETLVIRSQVAALRAKQLRDALIASRTKAKQLITARRMLQFVAVERRMFYPQDFAEERTDRLSSRPE